MYFHWFSVTLNANDEQSNPEINPRTDTWVSNLT